MILAVGRGSLLVKADIQEAYRMIPVHPQDQPLLGVHWNNFIYIDRVLPLVSDQPLLYYCSGRRSTVNPDSEGYHPPPSLPG